MFLACKNFKHNTSTRSFVNWIKSDRLNALKKKYDAYLEEDKKRKERNEYILEKFDKMRCSTALVHVRQKPGVIEDHRKAAFCNVSKQTLENPSYYPVPSTNQIYLPPEVPYNQIDESLILQEISKKYILIPKSRPVPNNHNLLDAKPERDNDNDWKSKYEILEKLKKNEKEDSDPTSLAPPPQVILEKTKKIAKPSSKENCKSQIIYSENTQNSLHDNYYSEKVSYGEEKIDNLDQKTEIHEDYNQDDKYKYAELSEDVNDRVILKEDFNTEEHITEQRENIDITKASDYSEPHLPHINLEPDDGKINTEIEHEYTPIDTFNTQEQYIQEDIDNIPVHNEQDFYPTFEEENSIPVVNSNDFVQEINNDVAQENKTDDTSEQLEYPVEIINVQDFTPNTDVHLEDGVNINPETEHVIKSSGDNADYNYGAAVAFAETNKGMSDNTFDPIVVNEDTDLTEVAGVESYRENVDGYYDEQDTENNAYNQEGGVDNYNTEYSAHTENYNQEEYAAYYEGAQIEQPYAIETNENEASLQRYDQSYQQQYGGDYPQEYQQGYEQYAQQEHEQNEYIGAQDTERTQQETIQYDNQGETVQLVEQVLDNEEGYFVEKQNEAIEVSDVEKTLNQKPAPKTTDQQVKA